jgi:type II secretory pathway pseudopilin PulG
MPAIDLLIPVRAFTLIELMVTLAFMAVTIPVIVQGLRIASLSGEVSERKALAARIADRVLNQTILNGQTSSPQSGNENVGPYQFHWTVRDEPWTALSTLTPLSNPNSVNAAVVNQSLIHQFSVDVTFAAQGRNFDVRLTSLVNTAPTQ